MVALVLLPGCGSMSQTAKGTAIGSGSGAVLGAIVGALISKDAKGAAIGAAVGTAVGAGTGAVIGKKMDKKAEELSKGMAQKVQFIITVLHKPDLMIFDEPFSGFDPVNTEALKREILGLKAEGHTIIFSTHNMASVEEICDEIALINRSKVVLSGNIDDIKSSNRSGRYEIVSTSGQLLAVPGVFDICSESAAGRATKYVIDKAPEISNSDLAAIVAKQVEIRAFSEQLPTMNDIFLKTVSNNERN